MYLILFYCPRTHSYSATSPIFHLWLKRWLIISTFLSWLLLYWVPTVMGAAFTTWRDFFIDPIWPSSFGLYWNPISTDLLLCVFFRKTRLWVHEAVLFISIYFGFGLYCGVLFANIYFSEPEICKTSAYLPEIPSSMKNREDAM